MRLVGLRRSSSVCQRERSLRTYRQLLRPTDVSTHVERHRDVRGFQRRDRWAKGYNARFLMQVKDGVVCGEHGSDGTPGWLRFDGRIQ